MKYELENREKPGIGEPGFRRLEARPGCSDGRAKSGEPAMTSLASDDSGQRSAPSRSRRWISGDVTATTVQDSTTLDTSRTLADRGRLTVEAAQPAQRPRTTAARVPDVTGSDCSGRRKPRTPAATSTAPRTTHTEGHDKKKNKKPRKRRRNDANPSRRR